MLSKARKWQEAISAEQVGVALGLADNICGDIPQTDIDPIVYQLFVRNHIRGEFINAEFNEWDFQYWKYATFFREMAKNITDNVEGEGDAIRKIFTSVRKQVEPVEPPADTIFWPYNIWHLKKGVCDRQAWVLCELTYQLGCETQIVYLRNPKDLNDSPHTICEIRKGAHVWLCDPYSDKLLPNTSVADLAGNPELKRATWPNREDWHQAIEKAAFWLPSYPQDYCPRNMTVQLIME